MGLTTKDKTVATSLSAKAILSEGELETLYIHGIPRRYVDAISDEILRHRSTIKLGGDLQGNSNDLIATFEEYLKVTQFHHAFAEVVKLQRLYGGAGLVLLIDDGLSEEEPVDTARIRSVQGYVPLSRHELIPEDFSITDYSKPSHYRVTTTQRLTADQKGPYVNLRIHSSRVARFDGLYLPWNSRVRNSGWGLPVLQLIWEAYKRYETAMAGLESMTTDSDLFVHKIPGLFNRIASGNESDLRKRLEANNLSRSVYGGMVVDTEEELSFLNRALSNIASATDPFVKDLQAATGWPASILMGDSPGGMGKEGRFEERVWASLVEQWQELYCRTAVTEVFTYILASKEGPTRGRPPGKWSVEFPSCFTETNTEKAALRYQMAQVDMQYINMGVLNPLEVRESRFAGTEYNIETNLNEVITEQLVVTADAQFEAQMKGIEAQREAALNPSPQDGTDGSPPEEDGGEGVLPEEDGGEVILPEEDGNKKPAEEDKFSFDSKDYYSAHGYKLQVSKQFNGVRLGHPVSPDRQRIDTSATAPLFVVGPHRAQGRRLFRARFDYQGELIDGPYAIGFRTIKSAKQAIASFYPRQNVAGLSLVPEGEAEALRAGWEQY